MQKYLVTSEHEVHAYPHSGEKYSQKNGYKRKSVVMANDKEDAIVRFCDFILNYCINYLEQDQGDYYTNVLVDFNERQLSDEIVKKCLEDNTPVYTNDIIFKIQPYYGK